MKTKTRARRKSRSSKIATEDSVKPPAASMENSCDTKISETTPTTDQSPAPQQRPSFNEITVPIAWSGEVEMLNATWSLDSGRQVEFRIVESPGVDRVNPFKQYTRRRAGHVGQLFASAICAVGQDQTMYDTDLMLAGWGDSHDKGQWVRFWLDEFADRHPFAGYTRRTPNGIGSMFMVTLVLLDSEGQPLDPRNAENIQSDHPPKKRNFSPSAHLMVTGTRFVQWMREKVTRSRKMVEAGRTWDGDLAKRWVKYKLGIESLAVLDWDDIAFDRFNKEIRRPFAKWNGEE